MCRDYLLKWIRRWIWGWGIGIAAWWCKAAHFRWYKMALVKVFIKWSKHRIEKFKELGIDHYNAQTIDISLIAVLTDVIRIVLIWWNGCYSILRLNRCMKPRLINYTTNNWINYSRLYIWQIFETHTPLKIEYKDA